MISLPNRGYLAFEHDDDGGVCAVRLLCPFQNEIMLWNASEFGEAPEEVLAAIAACSTRPIAETLTRFERHTVQDGIWQPLHMPAQWPPGCTWTPQDALDALSEGYVLTGDGRHISVEHRVEAEPEIQLNIPAGIIAAAARGERHAVKAIGLIVGPAVPFDHLLIQHAGAYLRATDPEEGRSDLLAQSRALAALRFQLVEYHALIASSAWQRPKLERAAVAEDAYLAYEFDAVVGEASGWEHTDPGNEWSRRVYIDTDDDHPSVPLTFVVRFTPDTDVIDEAYAIDGSGQIWGHRPGATPAVAPTP